MVSLVWRANGTVESHPLPKVALQNRLADEQRCADCHEQAEWFHLTGHAQTLRRGDDPLSVSKLKQLNESPAFAGEGGHVDLSGPIPVVSTGRGTPGEGPLEWCFGSGYHAHTWVATLADTEGVSELMEFRWTWYAETGEFDITPGQPDNPGPGYFQWLGLLFDHPKARRCFACHATRMPSTAGRLDWEGIVPGVTCQRCHGSRVEHVATDGEVTDGFWSRASQMESVNRCAECHRRADEEDTADINTENPDIVRFQPVGLVQSPCFQNSEMTCITCHDPHRPLSMQDSTGIWQCVQCHDPDVDAHTLCAGGHRGDCLRCHMPKVSMERPLQFTDHWIRVRRDDE